MTKPLAIPDVPPSVAEHQAAPSPAPPALKPIPRWVIVVGIPVMVLVAVAMVWLLLGLGVDSGKLDAIRTGGTVGVGLGGVVVLWLAVRRQRSTELDLLQKYEAHQLAVRVVAQNEAAADRTFTHGEHDARERRVTELYVKAVEQLGSDKAVVRLGGLYALERLGQNNESQRKTIVDVLCGYLRMPFAIDQIATGDDEPGHDVQELQVRITAQLILHRHLGPVLGGTGEPDPDYWGELNLDLTGATLVRFALGNTSVRFADFRRARFIGPAQFQGARFSSTMFSGCQFDDLAWFESTSFGEAGLFDDTRFLGRATFVNATFGNALFHRTRFAEKVAFDKARFVHNLEFDDAVFDGSVSFSGARVRVDARRKRTLPQGWTVQPAADGQSDRLETVIPQRWRPNAAVSAEERDMRSDDQVWGYLDRS